MIILNVIVYAAFILALGKLLRGDRSGVEERVNRRSDMQSTGKWPDGYSD